MEEIASVPKQIISPAKSTPIISVVQDSMIGSYLMTQDPLVATSEDLFQYLMPIIQLKSNFNLIEAKKKRFWSGKELFSTILPNVSLDNGYVSIHNGEITDGFIDKKTIGGGSNGIIQAIFNQYGPHICRDFLDNLQRLVVAWMENYGFTVGFGDAIPPIDVRDNIQEVLKEKNIKADETIRKSQLGLFKPELSDKLRMTALEIELMNITAETSQDVENIVQENMPKDNHFIQCVKSGSKGNATNLNQIMGTVGQQMVDGKRIAFGWNGRTLAHFTKWDNSLPSRGFVSSSYMKGLGPHEFFFLAMGARVGSINSHIRTAETGYIQRRLIKAMEDLSVRYDDTVRDASNNIIQYVYGRDGFDPMKLEHVPLKLIGYNNQEMEREFMWEEVTEVLFTGEAYARYKNEEKDQKKVMEGEFEKLVEERDVLRYKLFKNAGSTDIHMLSPINFKRMIQEIKDQFHIAKGDISDLTPKEVIEGVNELIKFTVRYTVNKKSFMAFKILIRSMMSSKQCLYQYRLPKSVFEHMLELMRMKILNAYISPGEMVGVVAAQSIGEPVTQLSVRGCERVQIAYEEENTMRMYNGTFQDFVDNLLEKNKGKVFKDENESYYLDLEQPFYVAGINQKEKVKWNKISQLTKHRPRGNMIKITTKSGREATCTLSHSFLKRGEKSVDPIKGSELKIGDRVPVIMRLEGANISNIQKEINVSKMLGIEEKNGKVIVDKTSINNIIKIDEYFCWFLGAYVAEGSVTDYHVELANINDEFKRNTKIFSDKNELNWRWRYDNRENVNTAYNTINNKIFSSIIKKLCGKGAYNKKVPDFIFQQPNYLVGEFLKGMFDGDGNVSSAKNNSIRYFSVSKNLLEQTALLLARFGIFTTINRYFKNNNPTMVLSIYGQKYIDSFNRYIGTDLNYKQRAIDDILNQDKQINTKIDKIPSIGDCISRIGKSLKMPGQSRNYGRWTKKEAIGRDTLATYYAKFSEKINTNKELSTEKVIFDMEIIKQAVESDVVWDRIEEMEIIEEPDEFVYDFTVPGNETFALANGIIVHNTLNTSMRCRKGTSIKDCKLGEQQYNL